MQTSHYRFRLRLPDGREYTSGVVEARGKAAVASATSRLESTLAKDQLRDLADAMTEPEFIAWLTMLFGADIPEQAYRDLRAALVGGRLADPPIKLVDSGLSGHEAAYDREQETILVSSELPPRALEDGAEAWKLLLALVAEYGHHLDHVLRNQYSSIGGDADLDEGVRLAYSLLDLDWEAQSEAEFGTFVDGEGEHRLKVEFALVHDAIAKYLNRGEEEADEQAGALEFFGSGRGIKGDVGSWAHANIEDALAKAELDDRQRKLIYFGNWLRDNSQIIDPKPLSYGFSRQALTDVMDVMARQEFENVPEFKVDKARLGLYRPEEHIDNPLGIEDARAVDPGFRSGCLPGRCGNEIEVNPATRMKRYIRSSVPGQTRQREAQEYHVQDGDSLKSIAERNGMTWQELARFNFGTDVPREINVHLREEVGCTTPTPDGKNLMFTSADDPGIIRIPGAQGAASIVEVGDTSLGYIVRSLREAKAKGRNAEGFRLLGQGLHTLEDYYAHTNFLEVSLCHLGYQVEPWVPRKRSSLELPIVSGVFGGLDTMMSLLCIVGEEMSGVTECKPGEQTAKNRIALILLKDQKWNRTHDRLDSASRWFRDFEKENPRAATAMCKATDYLFGWIGLAIGGAVRSGANVIDDAESAYLQDPNSTNPTHSQVAKDHAEHPLHQLAAQLASDASLEVAKVMQRAWNGEATADDVVAAASALVVHPADLPQDGAVLKKIAAWGKANPAGVRKLSSRSEMIELSKQYRKRFDDTLRKLDELSKSTPAVRQRIEGLLRGLIP